ncbi:MAG TPA: MFS transporter [Anaerolineaceae bacterium]|nr:MFS transporter [Anaerolineaceae bacterium]
MTTTDNSIPKNWAAPFFTIWTGQAFSMLGSQLVQFALVWWLTKSTGSATVLATATLAALIPQIVISPFAGALVDRWNRKVVMMVADSLIALASLVLALLFAAGVAQPWHVYLIMLIRGTGGAFHWPAMSASTPMMVPKEHLARVAGVNQTMTGLLNIVSPPLGALLISYIPISGVLFIDVVTAALAVAPLFFVHVPQPQRVLDLAAGIGEKTSMWQDLKAGLRYVVTWPGMFIILMVATLLNFFVTPAFSLIPLLVTKHFGGDAIQLGALDSAWGIGMLTGGIVLGAWGGFKRRIVTTFVGVIGMGLGITLIGFSPANLFWLAVAGMAFTGLMQPITNGPLFAVVQSIVDSEMQGRVLSLINAMSAAMSPLSLAVAGPVSDALGIRVWYVIAGVFCVLVGILAFFIPAVIHIEEQKKGKAEAQPTEISSPETKVETESS